MKKLIVGLGNYGLKYISTRHNIGFMFVDVLAKTMNCSFSRISPLYDAVKINYSDVDVILLKPMTYMNLSGKAVVDMVKKEDINISDILVICDDVDIPLGGVRLRKNGSSGGHNGLISIITELQTDEFARLKVGIGGREHGDLVDHVLGKFSKEELEAVNAVIEESIDRVRDFIIKDS